MFRLTASTPEWAPCACNSNSNDPPEGLAIEKVSPSSDGADIVLSADAAKLKPGLRGNLVFNAYASRAGDARKGKQNNSRRALLGALPAVPFEIVGK
jgi:hypothetical protein